MDYQAYSALALVPLEQIDTSREDVAVIHITPTQNKTRQDHQTLVPKPLMEMILNRCKELNLPCPFPNYAQLWKEITAFAKKKFSVRLTSHYLRKRFATIASDTPMDVNQWDYLMGTKKSKGHEATIYNLTFLDEKLIPDYQRYLQRSLSLEKSERTAQVEQPKETEFISTFKATIE